MKKIIFILFCWVLSSAAFASEYNVRIINNSPYQMTVRYAVCPVNLKKPSYDCQGALLEETKIEPKSVGIHYASIPIYDLYWYVKVLDVVEKDNNIVKAQADFRLHVCSGYYDRTIILDDYGTPFVTCVTESR